MFKKINLRLSNHDSSSKPTSSDPYELKKSLDDLGIKLDTDSGHLFYTSAFKSLKVNFELLFIRHGETYGNCGQCTENGEINNELLALGIKNHDQRIFQGNVDTQINQLTALGQQQALAVAEQLKRDFLDQGWEPDLILLSPLLRARNTAWPFIADNQLENRCCVLHGIREMSFGAWENRRICDIPPNDPSHLFYKNQHALVKSSLESNSQGSSENFCEVLLRTHQVLTDLQKDYAGKRIIMFSHSMVGASCCFLFGDGQKIEDGDYLAFDGKRTDGTFYTIPHAVPFPLNFTKPSLLKNLNNRKNVGQTASF